MYAPNDLHILAKASGLSDEDVGDLWREARALALQTCGDNSHPKFERKTHQYMMRLIEDEATADIPTDLVPWVLFDLHLGAAFVDARRGIRVASNYLAHHLPGKHAA
jgi:hypothetical protein